MSLRLNIYRLIKPQYKFLSIYISRCSLTYNHIIAPKLESNFEELNLATKSPKNFWTIENIEKLLKGYKEFNGDFKAIKRSYFPAVPCSEIERRFLKFYSRRGCWSEPELKKLEEAVKKYGENWKLVSQFVGTRTPVQCRQKFKTGDENPNLNAIVALRFTKLESNKLLNLIEMHGTKDWDIISKEFGPTRNQNQLLGHYKYLIEVKSNLELWTDEEDKKLIDILKQENFKASWSQVSNLMKPHIRSPLECYSRYFKINPNLKKGQWGQTEIDNLLALTEKYYKQWPVISRHLKTRTPYDCEFKYYSLKFKDLKTGLWSKEETEKLKELYLKYGKDWNKIAMELQTRTPRSICTKFKWLNIK